MGCVCGSNLKQDHRDECPNLWKTLSTESLVNQTVYRTHLRLKRLLRDSPSISSRRKYLEGSGGQIFFSSLRKKRRGKVVIKKVPCLSDGGLSPMQVRELAFNSHPGLQRAKRIVTPCAVALPFHFEDALTVVMPRLDIDLHEACAYQQLSVSPNLLKGWWRDILIGLDEMHRTSSVAHRDIKPSNVVIHRQNAYLVDLAMCNVVCHNDESQTVCRTSYSAPEVWGYELPKPFVHTEEDKGLETQDLSDMWSFGCLVFATLFGILPFSEGEETSAYGALKKTLSWIRVVDNQWQLPLTKELVDSATSLYGRATLQFGCDLIQATMQPKPSKRSSAEDLLSMCFKNEPSTGNSLGSQSKSLWSRMRQVTMKRLSFSSSSLSPQRLKLHQAEAEKRLWLLMANTPEEDLARKICKKTEDMRMQACRCITDLDLMAVSCCTLSVKFTHALDHSKLRVEQIYKKFFERVVCPKPRTMRTFELLVGIMVEFDFATM